MYIYKIALQRRKFAKKFDKDHFRIPHLGRKYQDGLVYGVLRYVKPPSGYVHYQSVQPGHAMND